MKRRGAPAERERRGPSALPAKASAPRFTNAIPRARVFRMFDRALARGAVWVAAPAGAGKTTAVASYLGARGSKALWYDVDATDTDVANVFLYLTKAIRSATRSRRRLPAFQVQHLGSLRAFTRKFFEALFAALPAGGTLVLDNCHTVRSAPAWGEILDEAIVALPTDRSLLLISREEPPAGLSRQLVNQRLTRVTAADLRFSEREADALARARVPARVRRQKQALSALCALADGWAAGLVLALDHAARGDASTELVRRGARLFDYFSEEVLSQLAPEAQHVLVSAALLPCITEPMASAVAGWQGAAAILSDLHRRGLLVERLPTAETTYRYHPLLRAFLLARADTSPAALARAAAACASGGFLDDAVALHAQAGADGEVAALVLAHAPRLVAEGRFRTLGAWLEKLSEQTLAAQPWLRFWQATANITNAPAASRAEFEQAFAGFQASNDAAGSYLTIAGAIQLVVVEADDFHRLEPWFGRLGRLLGSGPPPPSDDIEAAALTSAILAAGVSCIGAPGIDSWTRRALGLAPVDPGTRARLWAGALIWLNNSGGLDDHADQLARLRPRDLASLDPLTRLIVNEAEIFHSVRTPGRRSIALFERGLALAGAEGLQSFEAPYLAGLAQGHAIAGDLVLATSYLDRAEAAALALPGSHLLRTGLLDLTRGVLSLSSGALEDAVAHFAESTAHSAATGADWGAMLGRTLRRVALHGLGRHDEAVRETASMTGTTRPLGITKLAVELCDVEIALATTGPGAASQLARALTHLRGYGSFAFHYLRGLPHVVEHGLRDSMHGGWLAGQLAEHRVRPWPEHFDVAAWPWRARVQTLGGFALSGQPRGRPARKVAKAPLRLLKCLVAAGGGPLLVGDAAEALWPGETAAAARGSFDVTVHRLRKLLGEDVIRLEQGALVVDRSQCFVDAWAFASLAARAERRLRQASGDAIAAEARRLLDEPLDLYRGALLPDDDDLPSVVAYRERLRLRFVHLVLAFGAALEPGATAAAVALYEKAIDIDELAEPISQQLMRGYLALGRPADAAKEYHRCQLALRAALGTPPAEETRALYQQAQRARA